ncbi:MAG: 2-acyl-2-O-sulfo-trehalose (hydroxy)phthioceranyltransferase [Mycobacterium sp.]|nr:2-acyl-2-O-sulfo-trehalose (hydroxy)phthioceranyltransferase [Mycobacterium sp.]
MAVGSIHDWAPEPGSAVSWTPSPAAVAKARQAPASAVPASYMQAEHLRSYCEYAAKGQDMARLCILAWDIAGQCDIRAMTYVINAHLRRHDTYRSWFEQSDTEHMVRRTINHAADIQFVPTKHGEITPEQWQELLLATPNPLQWDCFRFMVIQYADHFTFCLSVDHLYIDTMFIGVLFAEIHMMYAALAAGRAPIRLGEAGSYLDYCDREHQRLSALTLDSPQVRGWIEFLENNDGTLPDCPLPLGDGSGSCELMTAQLMDERQTARFESACIAANARFSGGVFACAALAEYELTGAETYYGLIATDTRSSQVDFMTMGWFTGFTPITVPVAASFGDTARAAQVSFDSGRHLADVPWARILELAPGLRRPHRRVPLTFHLDAGVPPLSALVNSHLNGSNAKLCHDGGVPAQFDIRVYRLGNETRAIVMFPNNPIARESVTRYISALKSVYIRVAEGRDAVAGLRDVTFA